MRATACLLTSPSPAGIAVVSLHGPDAERLLGGLFRPARAGGPGLPPLHRAALGTLELPGKPLDEVLVIRTGAEPPSFEIGCHGGEAASGAVLDALAERGARIRPWEALLPRPSLERDLLQDLLGSRGRTQAELLAHLLSGTLSRAFREVLGALKAQAAGSSHPGDAQAKEAAARAHALAGSLAFGRFLHSPPRVAITGPVNAGKSTLFNAILGEHRALTSRIPGTTRDPVEARFLLVGFPIRLFDLPGPTAAGGSDPDALAADTAAGILEEADLVLYVRELTRQGIPDAPTGTVGRGESPPPAPRLSVWNKSDLLRGGPESLPAACSVPGCAVVSAATGDGIEALLREVKRALGLEALVEGGLQPVLTRRVQAAMMRRACKALARGVLDARLIGRLETYLSSGRGEGEGSSGSGG